MSSLGSILDIAKNALMADQQSISVTAHNIANANTPGYTRQEAVLVTMPSIFSGGLFYGTGVTVQSIRRVYDAFQAGQIRNANSNLEKFSTSTTMLKKLEASLNDFGATGLSGQIDSFFNSFQDLANSPSTYAERSVLLSNATVLADKFTAIDATISKGLADFKSEMQSQVTQVNSISKQIASLNEQITSIEVGGATANDLRDKRDLMLNNLSKLTDISVRENASGMVDVQLSGGPFLVAGVQTADLALATNSSNINVYNIVSNGVVMNDRMTGGSLKGLLDAAQQYQAVQNNINNLASGIMKNVNLQNRAGYGLDGSTGQDIFINPDVYVQSESYNTGGAVATLGTITNLGATTLDNYQIRFSGPANYNIFDTTTNSLIGGGAYTSGSAITFAGLSVTVSDNVGTPQAGDTFTVNITTGAAGNMTVGMTDTNKIAASATAAGLPGDNTNALALAALRDGILINNASFGSYYNGTVVDLGVMINEMQNNLSVQQQVSQQLNIARDASSGVSMEEEAISLVKLQKSYEAAAKVMSTVNTMYDTLLSIKQP